jgi:hypothetical protein
MEHGKEASLHQIQYGTSIGSGPTLPVGEEASLHLVYKTLNTEI